MTTLGALAGVNLDPRLELIFGSFLVKPHSIDELYYRTKVYLVRKTPP